MSATNRSVVRTCIAVVAMAASLLPTACGRGGDDLWHRSFEAVQAKTPSDVTGYWQGDVAMGGIRVRIDAERMTIALRCDRDGRVVSQA